MRHSKEFAAKKIMQTSVTAAVRAMPFWRVPLERLPPEVIGVPVNLAACGKWYCG